MTLLLIILRSSRRATTPSPTGVGSPQQKTSLPRAKSRGFLLWRMPPYVRCLYLLILYAHFAQIVKTCADAWAGYAKGTVGFGLALS